MSDLISRQSAIYELLKERPDEVRFCFPCREVLNIIKNLPSAQKWIPVSERLPEKIGDYLVCDEYGNIFSNFYHPTYKRWGARNNTIIAWMPLPEPYKEAEA